MSADASHVPAGTDLAAAIAAEPPTSEQIARRAYAAMCKPCAAQIHFNTLLGLAGLDMRRPYWLSLTDEERAATQAYAGRRLELREVYGPQAEQMHERESRLDWLRTNTDDLPAPTRVAWVKRYYALDGDTLADFINDWGYTIDPRLVSEGKSAVLAFSLFPKQRDLINKMIWCWHNNKPLVVVKSRDVGASWVAMALLCTLCIFRTNFAAGVASATEVKLDRSGDPDTLFYKARSFLEHLPVEFNAGWSIETSAYMRITFPQTGSSVTGEAGDHAGRGGRKAIYVVDESAHFEHPKIIDKNLSATTRCRIDMSSVNGMDNSFYTRAHNAAIPRFTFTWKDDPRKTQAWYDQMCLELDEVVVKQELDCDFRASLAGQCIPFEWAEAMIGIDEIVPQVKQGSRRAALDIADRGNDLCAFVIVQGRMAVFAEQWSGKGSDTGYSVQKAMGYAETHGMKEFDYDADGMGGAAVHSDARMINEARLEEQKKKKTTEEYFASGAINAHPYRGSEAVVQPNKIVPGTKRKAEDFFYNRKAQTWYMGRIGAFHAWKARKGKPFDPDLVAGIAADCPHKDLLCAQLAQATVKETLTGKIQIDKNPDDVSSPDIADAYLMANAPRRSSLKRIGMLLTAVSGGQ